MIGSQWRERTWLDLAATIACALGLAMVMAALLGNFYYYINFGLGAIGYPYELDYGEGVVWQQMADLPNGRMYTSIHEFPYLVYPYTPLYHTVAYIAATLIGDPLSAGRAVSMASALLLAAFVGIAVAQASGRSHPSSARLIGAVIAALLLFTFRQVSFWSVLMRVDMLAIMLSVLGFNLFLASLKRPWLIYPCGLAFVLALLAKQNTIAGAVACCGVSLMVRPALTLRAIALSATMGGAALAVLTFVTDGEFLRHVIFYNLNDYDLKQLFKIMHRLFPEYMYVASLVVVSAGVLAWQLVTKWRSPTSVSLRADLVRCPEASATFAILIYFLLAMISSLGAGKVGSNDNYIIEWLAVWSMIVGLVIVRLSSGVVFSLDRARAQRLAFALAGVVGLIVIQIVPIRYLTVPSAANREAPQQILEEIQAMPGPVWSEDMMLVMRAGKSVPLMPFIMTQLSQQGLWDQSEFIDRLRGRYFDLVIVKTWSDDRFTPEMKEAVLNAYPVVEKIGRYLVYRHRKGEG